MSKNKLCLGTFDSWDISYTEQITMFKNAGFDGFFVTWNPDMDVKAIKAHSDKIGMYFQSIHAPYTKSADMWTEGEKADTAVKELLSCLSDCAENGVLIMVCHAYIGFDFAEPNECGIKNFSILAEKARDLGVKIAFENCEQEKFLDCLMKAFENFDNVGFCFDTGHEMCYNKSKDILSFYGKKLIAIHINDNFGVTSPDGIVTWTDDLHLLPFDGVADWENIAFRLNKYGYKGELTLELTDKSKPDRHENDKYIKMGRESYLNEAFCRAERFSDLKEKSINIFL